jgi:hypothetical protein
VIVRAYRPADRAAVIGVIGMVGIEQHRRLYESSGYRLEREERDAPVSHKSAGAGLTRYHYEKTL